MNSVRVARQTSGFRRIATYAIAGLLAVGLAACGGGGGAGSGASASIDQSSAVTLDNAETATVKIQALGSLVDPVEGALEGGWWGTGLIVNSDGLVVTNNHVVVGAATLKATVGGKSYDARILGTSECLDLAVIKLDGKNFPHFDWYTGDIKAALEVWALGYPNVGDREFAITKGIVSKADTATNTQWASVNHAIEHDARIRGGNSGGPLVAANGQVVGVNYAGDDINDLNLAIHRDEVQAVYDDLAAGKGVLSLGVNATAFVGQGGSGVFVRGVASGSTADKAGLEPGDIITRMEGVTLATDGTLADYCSILRTHGTDATLSVDVYRPSEGATYEGQFNGRTLTTSSVPAAPSSQPSATPAGNLVVIKDDAGVVSVQVPATWTSVDGASFTDDLGNKVNDVRASTNLETFMNGWTVSGVIVSASVDALGDYTPNSLLDILAQTPASGCTQNGTRQPFSDSVYDGVFEYWSACGGLKTEYFIVAATAKDGSHLIWLQIQLAEGDDWALDPIVNSFIAIY